MRGGIRRGALVLGCLLGGLLALSSARPEPAAARRAAEPAVIDSGGRPVGVLVGATSSGALVVIRTPAGAGQVVVSGEAFHRFDAFVTYETPDCTGPAFISATLPTDTPLVGLSGIGRDNVLFLAQGDPGDRPLASYWNVPPGVCEAAAPNVAFPAVPALDLAVFEPPFKVVAP